MHPEKKSDAFIPSRTFCLTIFGVFFAITLAVFGASLSHGFSMIDDPYLIQSNLAIRGPTLENLRRIFTSYDPELYIPATLFSYQLNYLIGGLHPFIYHLTNLVLHAINGCLIAWLLILLTRRKWLSVFCALFWLIHPLNTEAVVWAAGRKDLLSTGFALGSSIAYLLQQERGGKRLSLLSLGLFLLALLSKASVFPLPVAFIVFDWMRRRPIGVNTVLQKIPFALLSLIFVIIALIGKVRVVGASSLLETALMAAKSTVFYLQKMLLPIDLTPLYAYQGSISILSPDFFVPILLITILIIVGVFSLRKTRTIAAGLLIFLMLLAPTYFNFSKGEQMFFAVDRYVYLPSIGLLLIIVHFAENIDVWLRSRFYVKTAERTEKVSAATLLLACAFLSVYQTGTWRSDELLLDHALAHYPDSVPVHLSLSVVYRESGRLDNEWKILEEGLRQHQTVAYLTGLGSVAARQGDLTTAEIFYERARALDPKNPDPLFFLGSLEEQKGNSEAAIQNYKRAIALDDSYTAAHVNLGSIYLDQRKLPEAEEQFRKALSWNPNSFEARYNLFQTLEFLKRNDDAFTHLQKAYDLQPDSEDIAIAYAYRLKALGITDKARSVLEKMLVATPEHRTAKRLLEELKTNES